MTAWALLLPSLLFVPQRVSGARKGGCEVPTAAVLETVPQQSGPARVPGHVHIWNPAGSGPTAPPPQPPTGLGVCPRAPALMTCILFQKELCFDDELVLQQLRYTGMLETVRIRRSGYSAKYTFQVG